MAKAAATNRSVLSTVKQHQKAIFSFVAIIIGIVFAYVVYKGNASRILDMMKASPDDIKAAMFGDEPYLFYCASKSSKDDEQLPSLLVDLHNARHSMMKFAKIDCYKIGSSGKSVYDRFQLDKKVKPVLFGTAPWFSGAKQVPAVSLKDSQKLIKYVDSSLSPKSVDITSTKELNKYCGFTEKNKVTDPLSITDTCIAFIKGKKYNNKYKKLEEILIRETPRGVKFVSVDYVSNVLSFDTSMENEDFDIKILAMRNGTHYLRMTGSNPATRDYFSTFITTAASTPLKGYTSNKNPITIEKISSVKKKKSTPEKTKKTKKANTSNPKNSDTPSKDHRTEETNDAKEDNQKKPNVVEDAEETDRINREREKARREEMDRQAREHFISEVDDAADSVDAHEEDSEEEVIEL